MFEANLSHQPLLLLLLLEAGVVCVPSIRMETEKRYAVVTGANKGIGLEIVRQLAEEEDVIVVLTARDEKRGMDAVVSLARPNVVFHQLDVRDPASVHSLAHFIQTQFSKLNILVNNAAARGVVVDEIGLKALNIDPITAVSWKHKASYMQIYGKETDAVQGLVRQTYEIAEECLNTNYYGCKRVTEALMPLLKLCPSGARIVNVTSVAGELKMLPNGQIRKALEDINSLTEEKLDSIIKEFLHDFKQGELEKNGWPLFASSYTISKMALNAYTRLLAKKYPDMHINCVNPGYVITDLTWRTGILTAGEGARGPVMLALLPNGGPSGCYFDQMEMAEF